jgi:hypothetical protein
MIIPSCFHGDTTADAKQQARLVTVHDPSPPALGAPRPRRLMKALVAAHPLPKGEGRNQQSRPAPLGRGRKSSPGGWAGPALPNGRPTRRTVQRLVPLYCRQEITDVL